LKRESTIDNLHSRTKNQKSEMPAARSNSLLLPALIAISVLAHVAVALVLSWQHLPVYEPLARIEPEPVQVLILPPPPPPEDRYTQLGEDQATGDAANASPPGEPLQQAPQADQVQADLSLDPDGTGQASPQADPQPPAPEPLVEPEQDAQEPVDPVEVEQPEPPAMVEAPLVDEQAPVPSIEPQPEPLAMAQATPPPALAPTPQAVASVPGDPSPQADTESDAFSREAYVEFSRGRTHVQLGRKNKIIRPRLTLYGLVDLVTRAKPSLVLEIRIDASGDVRDVQILRSSGSPDVDQACRVAAYQWWFEPRTDAQGQPLAEETFPFMIRFR
jgi:periplasmic protein TonB